MSLYLSGNGPCMTLLQCNCDCVSPTVLVSSAGLGTAARASLPIYQLSSEHGPAGQLLHLPPAPPPAAAPHLRGHQVLQVYWACQSSLLFAPCIPLLSAPHFSPQYTSTESVKIPEETYFEIVFTFLVTKACLELRKKTHPK